MTGSLLLLYGLHPEDFETRVRRAVDGIPHVELPGSGRHMCACAPWAPARSRAKLSNS